MYLCRYIPTLCIRNCDVVVVKKNLLGYSNFLYSNTKVQYNKIIVGKVEPDKPRHVQKDCIFQKHKTFRGVRKEYSGTRLGYFLPKIVKVYYKIYGPIFVVLLRSIIQKSFWTLTTDLKIPTNCILLPPPSPHESKHFFNSFKSSHSSLQRKKLNKEGVLLIFKGL